MREINFSVPNSNRASVGITTALYDRRALDCTSTLPLINSLNHLAYLTTSSARIREILTVDGGVERLVNILKNGRNKDMLDTWKWNLAFQCLVNVGVRGSDGKGGDSRGSENIRTRVVEADIVPVVATILDNYIQLVEGLRSDKDEEEVSRSCSKFPTSRRHHTRPDEQRNSFMASRGERRREAPPPLSIPAHIQRPQSENQQQQQTPLEQPPASRRVVPSSPPHDQWTSQRSPHPHSHQHAPNVHQILVARHNRHESAEPQAPTTPASETRLRASTWAAPASPRPADAHLIPPMTAGIHAEVSSQPETPTTPRAASHHSHHDANQTPRGSSPNHLTVPQRPSIRRHVSMSGLSDDDDQDPVPPEAQQQTQNDDRRAAPAIGLTEEMDIEQLADRASILEAGERNDNLEPNVAGDADLDGLNLARGPLDGSIIEQLAGAAARAEAAVGLSPATQFQEPDIRVQAAQLAAASPISRGATPMTGSIPQEGDVILSLQLLAYVSKYCHLRNYFQKCHLVPRLKIQNDIKIATGNPQLAQEVDEEDDNEFCTSQDYNIFPLVEKFTVRNHPSEMRYWAGVVMRNLCRKDKSRGDIRQCAYYKCGKWEDYPREFAKCRRCRQTKYCSKECQKSAWAYHRHWCQVPSPSAPGGGAEAR